MHFRRRPFRSVTGLALGLALMLEAGLDCSAAETGVIPYRTIAALFQSFSKFEPRDKLDLSVQVIPAPKVQPVGEIQLEIRSRQGVLPLKRNARGDLTNFPLTPELQQENPGVASNQPKGTLLLRAGLGIKYSGKTREEATYYRDAASQADAAMKSLGTQLSLQVPKIKTLVFHFDPAAPATLRLSTGAAGREKVSDAKGEIRLSVVEDLSAPQTTLAFAQIPLFIGVE